MSKNQPTGIWKTIALIVISVLITAFPSWLLLSDKPTKEQVSLMIIKEAPLSISTELKEIRQIQKSLEIGLAKQSVHIEAILNAVKK